jgi:hypothetical protein
VDPLLGDPLRRTDSERGQHVFFQLPSFLIPAKAANKLASLLAASPYSYTPEPLESISSQVASLLVLTQLP